MRVLKSLLAVAAAVGTLLTGTTAAQAAGTGWTMTYGATQTKGAVTWTGGRTIYISGSLHAASGLRRVCYWGVNGNYDTGNAKCHAANAGETVTWQDDPLSINIPGGVQKVYAVLYIEDYVGVHQVWCTRASCGTLS